MFTFGRAGGQRVLVWEGGAAAPASSLVWHSPTPVEVFFHTGGSPRLRALSGEFTRQLDRQLSALSLLSAQRLLEGIRAYRAQGRAPTSKAVKQARQDFIDKVTVELTDVHGFSRSRAREVVGLVDKALVVLHESDQVTYGPGDPALAGGLASMGVDQVNSSIGSQGKAMAAVLERAVLAVPVERRADCRLRIRAVLTASRSLARNLRHARVVLEPRSTEQVGATSARAPPWTPARIAAGVTAAHHQAAIPASTPATDPGPGAPPGAGRITPHELLDQITARTSGRTPVTPAPQTPPAPGQVPGQKTPGQRRADKQAPADPTTPTAPTMPTTPTGASAVPTGTTVPTPTGGRGPVHAASFPTPATTQGAGKAPSQGVAQGPGQAPVRGAGPASARTPRQVKAAVAARAAGQDRAPAPPARRKSPGLDR